MSDYPIKWKYFQPKQSIDLQDLREDLLLRYLWPTRTNIAVQIFTFCNAISNKHIWILLHCQWDHLHPQYAGIIPHVWLAMRCAVITGTPGDRALILSLAVHTSIKVKIHTFTWLVKWPDFTDADESIVWDPFYYHGLTLIPAWISNYIHYKVWDEITYPFINFNGATVEVKEWISNFISHFTVHVPTYPYWDQS